MDILTYGRRGEIGGVAFATDVTKFVRAGQALPLGGFARMQSTTVETRFS